eukprot:TRINITY_DN5180_c0_g2_i1.p1 TRINITY_DN5180_c0_g2~~TRINITY_DN5180_c0_g2_i1.p1  ORF type:complete len:310 (+),score=114.36 TRINITY_DN5180_c0_g2_i1:34-963(+)
MAVLRVSLLGLGKMGAAMATRLAATGHPLVLWNRSLDKAHTAKAEILRAHAAADVAVAETAAAAVAGGDGVVVMVLSSMATTAALLESLRGTGLAGRTLVNLTSGNPSEGREIEELAQGLGVDLYIDGAYSGPPAKAAAGGGTLFLSGPSEDAVQRVREGVLDHMGKTVYAGVTGASRALDYAVVDMFMANYLFYTANLSMLEAEGVDPQVALQCIRDRLATVPAALDLFRERQQSRDDAAYAAAPIATVDTWRNFLLGRVPYMQANGMATVVPEFVGGMLTDLAREGHGGDDMSRLQEIIRHARPPQQ